MKRNKIISILIVTILLVFIMYFIFGILKKNNVNHISETNNNDEILTEILQDKETGEFIIYDKETSEEIARSFDKSSLRIYEIDPSYNPLIAN